MHDSTRRHEKFHAGQHVEYYSANRGYWVEAVVQHVRSDGSVRLDIKRRADPRDIREVEWSGSDDDDSDSESLLSYSSGGSSVGSDQTRSSRGRSQRRLKPPRRSRSRSRSRSSTAESNPLPPPSFANNKPELVRVHVATPHEPYSQLSIDPEPQSELPPGWETRRSTSTGDVYYLNIVTQESTYERPLSSALPRGWTHDVSRTDGTTYFISPDGEASWDPPRDKSQDKKKFKIPFLPISISVGS